MSVLELPRIHFRGRFQTNVATANNNNVSAEPVLDVAEVGLIGDRGDEDFRRYLEERNPEADDPDKLDKWVPGLRGGWNYYGDGSCRFEAVVTSAELPSDEPGRTRVIDSVEEDAVIGAAVSLKRAVMVDLDPAGATNTQIFAERFLVSGPDRLGFEGRPEPCFSRSVRLDRNLCLQWWSAGSAVFQAVLPDDLQWRGSGSSACLRALKEREGDEWAGLTLRFCIYALKFGIQLDDLAERFSRGEHPENPAVGEVVGTIGRWRHSDMRSVTLGRSLLPPRHEPPGKANFLGPAVAAVDTERRVVTLDLVNTFPEGSPVLDKVDYGPAHLMIRGESGKPDVVLGSVRYDKASYEATSGICEVEYPEGAEADIEAGRLVLRTGDPSALIEEVDLVVQSDDRCVYMDEGTCKQVCLQVRRRGGAPSQPICVWAVVTPWDGTPEGAVEVPEKVEVPPEGKATLVVTAKRPGGAHVRFFTSEEAAAEAGTFGPPKWSTESFIDVRVLPADDECDELTGDKLTFDALCQQVIRHYHLLYPAMSLWVIDLSSEAMWSDPGFVSKVRARITMDRESFEHMPRSRDLSAGKRRLLERWCERVLGDG